MFRGRAQYAGFTPREGDKVEVRALVTLYGARGDYQINVEAIRRAGVGALYEAFQRLKEKLAAQGLFDQERKRAIPMFARSIGIVTSPQAAALRDVLIALKRRAPHVNIILYPTPVQGQQAPEKIAHAIRTASTRAECDVLLVCRGGGSIEDLWSFNDEAVAHAIADCSMPVISGVGHETDFTIADFAADLRAATPTGRPNWRHAARRLDGSLRADAADLRRAMRRSLDDAAQTLDRHSRRLLNPKAQLQQQRLQLLALSTAMTHAARAPVNQSRYALERLRSRWAALRPDVTASRARLVEAQRRSGAAMAQQLGQRRHRLDGLAAQLELLNPQRTLERGYAILRDEKGISCARRCSCRRARTSTCAWPKAARRSASPVQAAWKRAGIKKAGEEHRPNTFPTEWTATATALSPCLIKTSSTRARQTCAARCRRRRRSAASAGMACPRPCRFH